MTASATSEVAVRRKVPPPAFRGLVTQIPSSLWAASRIPRHHRRNAILFTYLRLLAKAGALALFRMSPPSREKLFGHTLHLLDYRAFMDVFCEIFVRRNYEFSAATSAPLIIDGGSNIGMGLFYFKLAFPRARIIAFEPNRETFAVLQRNREANGWNDVELHNCALAGRDGPVDFFFEPQRPGSLAMSAHPGRYPEGAGHEVRSERVEAVRLSPWIREPVDFLKLDVEGSERDVLEELGAAGKLGLVRQMVVEYHHHLNPDDDTFSGFLALLERAGFGYQLLCATPRPFAARQLQDVLVYAYQRPKDHGH